MNSSTSNMRFGPQGDPPQRITPSSTVGKKRHQGPGSGQQAKRRKTEHMDLDPIFPKLDQSDPVHARRIQQRRKTIAMGKNTAGYAEYVKKVPTAQRRQRSMDTPSTPDHTLDIPTKRWQGMVKAWRKALHDYDPADLKTNTDFNRAASETSKPVRKAHQNAKGKTVQSRQIEDAIAKGSLVDFSPPNSHISPNRNVGRDSECYSPASVLTGDNKGRSSLMDLNEWDDHGFMLKDSKEEFGNDDEDSDDDLL